LRTVLFFVSVALLGAGTAFLVSGETFVGIWLLAIGALTALLNAYRLRHPLRFAHENPVRVERQ
jgi:hypothetical protein